MNLFKPLLRFRVALGWVRRCGFNYIPLAVMLSILSAGASAQPDCRMAFEEPEFAFAAGCMVKSGDRMLVVRHVYGGKLGFPAGRAESGESAQCVAHRETWEETGMEVIVHGMLTRFRNGFALYRCELVNPDAAATDPAVPRSGRSEVSQVLWLDPGSTRAADWRFPRDYPVIIELFDQWPNQ